MTVPFGAGGEIEGFDYRDSHLWERWRKYKAWYGKWRGIDFEKIRREESEIFKTGEQISTLHPHDTENPQFYRTQGYLYQITRRFKPKTIVELGVERGCSTYAFLQAIHDNQKGHLYSLDIIPKLWPWKITKKMLAPVCPPDLKDGKNWTYREGNTLKTLPKLLGQLGTIDMMYHDADHTFKGQLSELQLGWKYGAKVLLVDYSRDVDFYEYPKNLQPQPSRVTDGVIIR